MDKQEEFKNRYKSNVQNKETDISEDLDMTGGPYVCIIDEQNVVDELAHRLPSVIFEQVSIEQLALGRAIAKIPIVNSDIIFIDTFYKDEETGAYAVDYFEMFREQRKLVSPLTTEKCKIVLSLDDMEQVLKGEMNDRYISAQDEHFEISKLHTRIKKYPRLEYRKGEDKIDIITGAIEEYAKKNKIYLYQEDRMSTNEWIAYLKNVLNTVYNELSQKNTGNRDVNCVISEMENLVNKSINELEGKTCIYTLESAIQYAEQLFKKLELLSRKLSMVNVPFEETPFHIFHEVNGMISRGRKRCFRQKKYIEEKSLTGNDASR